MKVSEFINDLAAGGYPFADEEPEMVIPKAGDVLSNGATVVHYTHGRYVSQDGHATGLVLAVWSGSEPYVVWGVTWSPDDDEWQLGAGGYCVKFSDALRRYQERGGVL